MTASQLPDVARWLPDALPSIQRNIVIRAHADIGIEEMPPGSNRSQVIDGYMDAVGSPRGMAWCAAALAAWFRDCGADVPPRDAGAADTWRLWAIRTNRWTATPQEGFAVVYGQAGHGDHVGLVSRLAPIPLNVEGNTSATGYSREGTLCTEKPVWTAMVLGYISPTPIGAQP